ncbi:putative Ferric/cupric reductase transmembrane component 1 [Tricladium varicosporioides]|nr:putative Ferric/cupric reductase transmembrane component 1 [Hymenoscyphus varicosporioides]
MHIQQADNTSRLVPHWGYVERVLPCTNDAGSCGYLDSVYWMHDVSMLYTFIMWAVIGGILALLFALRVLRPRTDSRTVTASTNLDAQNPGSSYSRAWASIQSRFRKWLLPESFVGFFGHVSRLQILVLAILLGYLLIFSLVGIVYKIWITPVKKSTLHNTRSGLGGFSDRVGALAYALTPLTVALSTRESLITLITGIPYQSLNFLHRWTGRIIFIQSFLHTLGWTLIEGRFYQPQPMTYKMFINETYIVWGVIAMALITFLYIFSLQRVIKWTGHEFFRKSHYIVAGVYFGACWAHWNHLACWMIASLGIFGLDRGIRLLRSAMIHIGYYNGTKNFGFHSAQSAIEYFDDEDGGVIRMEFQHNHEAWDIGQHFYLTFPALTIWQAHPMTVASVPEYHPTAPHHTYIIRCRKGETGRLKKLVLESESVNGDKGKTAVTPVIICGPYGTPLLPTRPNIGPHVTNLLAIAGGTGISIALPLVLCATASPFFKGIPVDLIWIIRRSSNIRWIASELEELKSRVRGQNVNLRIHIYITQEAPSVSSEESHVATEKDVEKEVPSINSSSSLSSGKSPNSLTHHSNFQITYLQGAHPSLQNTIVEFLESRAVSSHSTRVVASGPNAMGADLRDAVAKANDGGKVWKGDKRWDVELVWDCRNG